MTESKPKPRPEPTPVFLDCYRARTDRLSRLAEFASRMGPSCGETTASGFDAGDSLDELAGPAMVAARDAALLAAFAAIEAIARQS